MSNTNATASWSGYSYQGQVGLLVALRQIQNVPDELPLHFLEYEICEDAAIYKLDNQQTKQYLSVHQVKAYYSAYNNTKSNYDSVLNGNFQTCGNGNDFLHTVVEITDWASSVTANTNSITRYPYQHNIFHCDTVQIETYLKNELRNILGNDEGRINSALHFIVYALDCKIREEHKKASKNLFDISFSLQQLNEIINNNENAHNFT